MHPLASVIQSLAAARPQAPDAEQPLDSSSPTQLGDAPATQASQAHEDAGPSDGQPADPESNSSWLSAMVSELINTEVCKPTHASCFQTATTRHLYRL